MQAVKVPNGTLKAPTAHEKSNTLDTASFRYTSLNRISIIFFLVSGTKWSEIILHSEF